MHKNGSAILTQEGGLRQDGDSFRHRFGRVLQVLRRLQVLLVLFTTSENISRSEPLKNVFLENQSIKLEDNLIC